MAVKSTTRPKSPTNMYINTLGLVSGVSCLFIFIHSNIEANSIRLAIYCMLSYSLPIVILESIFLKSYANISTGINYRTVRNPIDIKRLLFKLLGLYFSYAFVAFIYWVFPEYHIGFYADYFLVIKDVFIWLGIFSVPYFIFIDRFSNEPYDIYWRMGRSFLVGIQKNDLQPFGQHLLSWVVKLFFLPLMFIFLIQNISFLKQFGVSSIFENFSQFYQFSFHLILFADLLIAAVGYVLALRIFDSHIRSTEPTLLGWGVTLACYQPFWSFVSGNYLEYGTSTEWTTWLNGYPIIFILWGTVILVLLLIYLFSSVAFGIRFSNLTHRGIFTNGPFRFTRHPAYLAKNISWWLISMPFLSTSGVDEAIRHSLLLLFVNVIYFYRAKTEERHLSWDPVYVKYAEYIDEKGMLAWLNRYLPVLKFRRYKLLNL